QVPPSHFPSQYHFRSARRTYFFIICWSSQFLTGLTCLTHTGRWWQGKPQQPLPYMTTHVSEMGLIWNPTWSPFLFKHPGLHLLMQYDALQWRSPTAQFNYSVIRKFPEED
ncbi:unnamed protein product, partial [Discosporangium mesarthrocarpum]